QFNGYLGGVMVTQNGEQTAVRSHGCQDLFHSAIDLVAWTLCVESIVARHDAQVNGQARQTLGNHFGETFDAIDVQIRQMQDLKTMKTGGQIRKLEADAPHDRMEGVSDAEPVQSGNPYSGTENRS